MNKVTKSLAVTVCLAGLALASQSAWAQNKHGNTYSAWAESWWTFALETPVLLPPGSPPSHPAFDVGSVDCSVGQDGHVWFLLETIGIAAGAQIQRACFVPNGTALFFPLYNSLFFNFASDPPLTPQFCADSARSDVESLGKITITALLDDKPLKSNAIQFEQSSIFAVEMPQPTATETNLLAFFGFLETDLPDWVVPASCDWGWYGYVEPMSVGHHVLEWKFDSSAFGRLYDMRYDLTVVPRNH